VPLRRSNVDTDQIIPAVYLKRVTRTGFEDGLFAAWRADEHFVLNQEPYRAGSVLVAGPDFGTGSSREHACCSSTAPQQSLAFAESSPADSGEQTDASECSADGGSRTSRCRSPARRPGHCPPGTAPG